MIDYFPKKESGGWKYVPVMNEEKIKDTTTQAMAALIRGGKEGRELLCNILGHYQKNLKQNYDEEESDEHIFGTDEEA